MKKIYTLLLTLIVVALASCSKEEDQYASTPCDLTVQPERVSFTNHVQPIVARTCASNSQCHNGSSSRIVNLTLPDELKNMVANGSFYKRIIIQDEATSCGKLDDSSREILALWIAQGSTTE